GKRGSTPLRATTLTKAFRNEGLFLCPYISCKLNSVMFDRGTFCKFTNCFDFMILSSVMCKFNPAILMWSPDAGGSLYKPLARCKRRRGNERKVLQGLANVAPNEILKKMYEGETESINNQIRTLDEQKESIKSEQK